MSKVVRINEDLLEELELVNKDINIAIGILLDRENLIEVLKGLSPSTPTLAIEPKLVKASNLPPGVRKPEPTWTDLMDANKKLECFINPENLPELISKLKELPREAWKEENKKLSLNDGYSEEFSPIIKSVFNKQS